MERGDALWFWWGPRVSPEALWNHVSSSLGPVDPSLRALSGRLKFTVRRHKFNRDSLSSLESLESWFQGRWGSQRPWDLVSQNV